jgi:hypothetical protein
VIALVLREWPDRRRDLLVLSAWGTLMCGLAWRYGPWMGQMVPGYWPIVGLSLVSWWAARRWGRIRAGSVSDGMTIRRAA